MKNWFLFCVVSLSSTLFAQTYLNGISSYEHLNKEYYIGALYLPDPQSNPMAILADNRAQKMVIKVTASRWSTRKFTEFWREGLALNNNLASDVTLTNQISEFIRLPKETLTTGDVLTLQYSPVNGTEVLLNNELLYSASGKSFFNALLRSWIGEVPHSRLFQSQILGNEVDLVTTMDSRISRFESTKTKSDRVGLVSNWKAAEKAIELAIAQAEEELRQQKVQEEAARRKAEADRKKREEERKAAQLAAEKARKEAEQAKAKEQTSEQIQQAVEAQREAERKAAELERALESDAERQQREAIALQYVRDKYQWEVLRDVYKRVSYPEWARQFEQEGVVTVNFLVGSQGQLLGITSVTPSDSGLLGQELRDAVTRAAPFNAFPTQITDRQLRVSVDYEFTLADRVAELPDAPAAPNGFEADSDLTSVQKAVGWAKYKESAVSRLQSSIEYPFWAQDLKQEGRVTAEVTIRKDGTISKVSITEKSRHKILNQEVEQAMDRVGSVEPFPSWVEDDILTVLVEHNFEL